MAANEHSYVLIAKFHFDAKPGEVDEMVSEATADMFPEALSPPLGTAWLSLWDETTGKLVE